MTSSVWLKSLTVDGIVPLLWDEQRHLLGTKLR
jgi:hypothetical protein